MTNSKKKKKNKKTYVRVQVNEHGVFVFFEPFEPHGLDTDSVLYTKKKLDEECMVSSSVDPRTGYKFAIVRPVDITVEV